MRCEWDENKRHGNLDKHGLDFTDAAALLLEHDSLIFEDTRKDYGERRYIALFYLAFKVSRIQGQFVNPLTAFLFAAISAKPCSA